MGRYGVPRRARVAPLLHELHWLLVRFQAQFKVLFLTFKACHGMGPAYLGAGLSQITSAHPLAGRSITGSIRQGPAFGGSQEVGLLHRGTPFWSPLPPGIRLPPFRSSLKAQVCCQIFGDRRPSEGAPLRLAFSLSPQGWHVLKFFNNILIITFFITIVFYLFTIYLIVVCHPESPCVRWVSKDYKWEQ